VDGGCALERHARRSGLHHRAHGKQVWEKVQAITGMNISSFCRIARRQGGILILLLLPIVAQASPPPSGVAPVLQPAGGFSIEGDLLANFPAANAGDWMLSTNSGPGGAVLDSNGLPINASTTFHFKDLYDNNDDLTFAGGKKWTDDPNTWSWTAGKPSTKTDINNALVHITTDADGHSWVIVAADRFSTSGDSYIDFEFLQNTLLRNTNGSFSSAGPMEAAPVGPALEPGVHRRRQSCRFFCLAMANQRQRRL